MEKVTIINFDMPFIDLVVFMTKAWLAFLIATGVITILLGIGFLVLVFILALFGVALGS